jgi:hypothetical protein
VGNESAGLKADLFDEIDGSPGPFIEVPPPLPDMLGRILVATILSFALLLPVWILLDLGLNEPWLRHVPKLIHGLQILISLIIVRQGLELARRPRLIVGKQGLRLRLGTDPYGLEFDWDEISYCHWSHYQPGILNIQIHGCRAWTMSPLPPTRFFVRVVEPYRARVEKAVRAIGKWADDLTESTIVAVPPAPDITLVTQASIDEIDAGAVPLVEIPRPRWKLILGVLGALTLVAYVLLLLSSILHPAGAGSGWLLFDALGIVALAALLGFAIPYWARSPEFSVSKQGIRLPFARRRVNAPPFVRVDLGLFAWDEVSFCRWSRFEPGSLQVQVKATRSENQVE